MTSVLILQQGPHETCHLFYSEWEGSNARLSNNNSTFKGVKDITIQIIISENIRLKKKSQLGHGTTTTTSAKFRSKLVATKLISIHTSEEGERERERACTWHLLAHPILFTTFASFICSIHSLCALEAPRRPIHLSIITVVLSISGGAFAPPSIITTHKFCFGLVVVVVVVGGGGCGGCIGCLRGLWPWRGTWTTCRFTDPSLRFTEKAPCSSKRNSATKTLRSDSWNCMDENRSFSPGLQVSSLPQFLQIC